MRDEEVEKGLAGNPRILLMGGAIIISLILLLLPAVFPELGIGGLRYGLDLDGGSWLQLRPEGAMAQVDADIGDIITHEYSSFLNTTVTVTGTTDTSVSFEVGTLVTPKQIESLGYGLATVSGGRGGVSAVTLQVDKNHVISRYLENSYKTEVVLSEDKDGLWYEIRKQTSAEELEDILDDVGGSVILYKDGVSRDTLVKTNKILEKKLNLFGLSDVKPTIVGREYILIDMAGIDIETAKDLAATPGKFEIRIQTEGNESIHAVYGEDIQSVGIHEANNGVWGVPFTLTQQGAVLLREAAIETNAVNDPLNHEVIMYLDNGVIFSAPLNDRLANNLKILPVQDMSASFGTDSGSKERAKQLESHLKAGALPVNVEVIGSGQVPASLGAQFKELTAIAGLLAIITVSFMIYLRYRKKEIMLPMIITSISEVVMILGIASATKSYWQLDLPAIAGIIAVIGTGIDHLVVITDEVLYEGKLPPTKVYLARISRAFGIILAAAATTFIAMLCLVFMGFGALKGFALTTIIGLSIGVLIARPAYARIIKEVLKEEQE
ncbi:MAG: preprotein translocase subunit SecD [Candidatus Methanocomedens sp.]|nr:MAG: preprotein translocase subunit SecD [ANME-2 cluster archaeon]